MTNNGPPAPPVWNPQKQALIPDREFDNNWELSNRWYTALSRRIYALWPSYRSSTIRSPNSGNISTVLGLCAGNTPGLGPRILRYTFAKDESGGVPLDLIVRLYDHDMLIQEWIERDIQATWTVREQELQYDPYRWDDIRVELVRYEEGNNGALEPRRILVSLVEMEIPYPDVFTFPYLNPATIVDAPNSNTVSIPPGTKVGDVILVCGIDGEAADGFSLIHSQPATVDHHYRYMNTWWKRATVDEPDTYTFLRAKALWAARISGAADLPVAVAGRSEPPEDNPFGSLFGIWTPSIDTTKDNCLILRISSNVGYITWTDPYQFMAWDVLPAFAASWKDQAEAGSTGEEYHGTGSFIYWVAQTIAIAPEYKEPDPVPVPVPEDPGYDMVNIFALLIFMSILTIVMKTAIKE